MQLQLIYDEIALHKQEEKGIREMYRDALANADGYSETVEKIITLREKKLMIENKVKTQMGKAWEKFEDIKSEVEAQKIMMTDVAMRDLMDGKTVEIKDDFDNLYEPVWSVKFKKTGKVAEK
jgi:hypothetical protein